uniref:M_domain domain-containing protein n=1 Tax=Meloidogyne hapla TaxID=6305 RepID=A0A1I8BDN4_MELHA
MNPSYFGATTLGGNPSALPPAPIDLTTSWKPIGHNSNDFTPIYNDSSTGGGGAGIGSKLITIWGHPMDYNDGGHADPAGSSTYAAAAANLQGYPNNGFCWNDSQQPPSAFHQIPPQYDQMPFQQPEAKFAAGIHEQSFHPQQQPHPPPQSNRYNRNSKWDQQATLRDDSSAFGNNLYATTPPYGMVHTFGGVGDNRLIHSNGQRGSTGPSQRWGDSMGSGGGSTIPGQIGKFGGCEVITVLPHTNAGPPPHHPSHQQHRGPPQMRGGNGTLFTAGPPPLHIAPPPSSRPLPSHQSHLIGGHMGGPPPAPTPLLPSLNQHSTHSIGTFGGGGSGVPLHIQGNIPPNGPNSNMQTGQIDDAYWHWQDPNSQLRKWKHDTGIAIWGDPIKQANTPIKRWTNFTSDEVVAEVVPGAVSGWGDLPPIGSSVNNNTNSNTNNGNADNNNHTIDGNVNNNVPQHFGNQGLAPNNQQQTNRSNSLSAATRGDWSTGNVILPQQHNQQQQSFNQNGLVSGGNGQFFAGMPPTSSETPVSTVGQSSIYQPPPSLLSSMMIDPLSGHTNSDTDQQSTGGNGSGESTSRKATVSPQDGNNSFGGGVRQPQQNTQRQANKKVSLADELSSLIVSNNHGLGGGSLW